MNESTVPATQKGDLRLRVHGLAAGFVGAVLASLCCLPGAIAIGLGASAATATSLFRLQDFQPIFWILGGVTAVAWGWWALRRSTRACPVPDKARYRDRVLYLILGAFLVVFIVLNQLLIPWLEKL